MQYKDYYETLGVSKTATAEEIKKAYRKLIRRYHPDLSKESDATQKTAEINEAYTVLSDPEKRQAYDSLGSQAHNAGGQDFRPPPGWDANFDFAGEQGAYEANFSDFFEQFFGRTAQSRQARRAGSSYVHDDAAMRGSDQYATIELAIEDAYHGSEQTLILRSSEVDSQGHLVSKEHKNHIKIPKGVFEGQHIRLAGKGHSGMGGAPNGDLLLEVKFKPDKRWRAQGRDVYQRLPLAPWEAALGKTIDILTPTGKKQVTVPAGSKTGSKLRLKELGIPAKTPGHLYLELEIVQPQAKTSEERQAFENLAKIYSDFNPRRDMGV